MGIMVHQATLSGVIINRSIHSSN